jgi:NADH-quinone oxidoreductase subunit M
VNYGPVSSEKNATLKDLTPREWAVLVPIVAVAVLMGVLPNLFLRPIGPSVDRLLDRFHHAASTRIQVGAASVSPGPTDGRASR